MDLPKILFGTGACVIGIAFCALAMYNLIKKKHGRSLAALGFFSIMLFMLVLVTVYNLIYDRFSAFLRGSMDALTLKHSISFERELEFIQNYLYLEQKRFGDALQVAYDIQEKDFLIPALTVQPIVENSVRHGIRKKLEGGCVKISSFRDEEYYIVKVEDDGIGFDTDKQNDDNRNHVGIANVTTRLNIMCEGKLEITSIQDKGTSVLIKIPVDGGTVSSSKISYKSE